MPNYQNSKIYKIVSPSNPELVYYGSTTQNLNKRIWGHKHNYKNDGPITSKKILCFDDFIILLVENFSCNNKEELQKKEGEYILNNNCVNKQVMGRTRKDYLEDNKDIIKEKTKIYRENNKEKIKINSEKYKEQRKLYYELNKEKEKERLKIYRENNKEKIRDYQRKYRELQNKIFTLEVESSCNKK